MWTWWLSRSSSAPVSRSDPNTPVHSLVCCALAQRSTWFILHLPHRAPSVPYTGFFKVDGRSG
jgi:hypothetical protein